MLLPLTNRTNPSLTEVAVAAREDGKPTALFCHATRDDVLRACRVRGIPVKDGRVLLDEPFEGTPSLAFGLAAQIRARLAEQTRVRLEVGA